MLQLISSEYVACMNLVFNFLQVVIKAVSNDSLALGFELVKVINYLATEECCAILKCRLVDDNLCTLCLDALHDAQNGKLTEIA